VPAAGLAHDVEDALLGVFRRQLQLAGDVVGRQLAQVGQAGLPVVEDEVVADAGSDEDTAHAGKRTQFPQQLDLPPVVVFERRAGFREQAAAVAAGPRPFHLSAGKAVHVGRGTADVRYHAPETGARGQAARFAEDGSLRTGQDAAALVQRDGAETALSGAAAVGGQRKADGILSADLAAARIEGVDVS